MRLEQDAGDILGPVSASCLRYLWRCFAARKQLLLKFVLPQLSSGHVYVCAVSDFVLLYLPRFALLRETISASGDHGRHPHPQAGVLSGGAGAPVDDVDLLCQVFSQGVVRTGGAFPPA